MNKYIKIGILLISTSLFFGCNSTDAEDHGHEHTEGEEHHEHHMDNEHHEQEEIVLEKDSIVLKSSDHQEMHEDNHHDEMHGGEHSAEDHQDHQH